MPHRDKYITNPPKSFKQRPISQAMAAPSSPTMRIDKGKGVIRGTPRDNYGAMPSSLSGGQSSATWVSHPPEDLDHRVVSLAFSISAFVYELKLWTRTSTLLILSSSQPK